MLQDSSTLNYTMLEFKSSIDDAIKPIFVLRFSQVKKTKKQQTAVLLINLLLRLDLCSRSDLWHFFDLWDLRWDSSFSPGVY